MRHLLCVAALALLAGPARAGAPAPPLSAADKFAAAGVVVTGKVTAIEKDPVRATAPRPGAKDEVAYKVAVVKIDTALAGAQNLTHIKVGFVLPDLNAPPARDSSGGVRPRQPGPELKEGQSVLVYASKHPTADFHVMTWSMLPGDLSTDTGKRDLELVKRFAAVLADPTTGLKSDKPEVRAEAATFLVLKNLAAPEFGTAERVPLGAVESQQILRGLAAVEWTSDRSYTVPTALRAFYRLGLGERDGWSAPANRPGEDYAVTTYKAFVKWLDGPGKDYRIKTYAPQK